MAKLTVHLNFIADNATKEKTVFNVTVVRPSIVPMGARWLEEKGCWTWRDEKLDVWEATPILVWGSQ